MAGPGFSGRLLFLLAVIVCFIAYVCESRRGGRGGRRSSGNSRYGRNSTKGGVVDYSDDNHYELTSVEKILMSSIAAAVVIAGFYWCCSRGNKICRYCNDLCLGGPVDPKSNSLGRNKNTLSVTTKTRPRGKDTFVNCNVNHARNAAQGYTHKNTTSGSIKYANDTKAGNADSGNKDSLTSSAGYSIVNNTEAGASDSAKGWDFLSAHFSSSTSHGLPYSTLPSDDDYSPPGCSSRYSDGLLYLTESPRLKPRGKDTFVNCSDNHAAEPTPAPFGDNDYPTSEHTTTTDFNDNNHPEPPSCENAVNFPAYHSADYTTDTTSGLPYSMNSKEAIQ